MALDLPLRAGDAAFTFARGAAAGAGPGTPVIVPFGRRLLPGVVLGEAPPRPDARPVLAAAPDCRLFPAPVVELTMWTARAYVSSVGEALAGVTPWAELWAGAVLRWSGDANPAWPRALRRTLADAATRGVRPARLARLLSARPDLLDGLAHSGGLVLSLPAGAAAAPSSEAARPPEDARPPSEMRPPAGAQRVAALVAEAMAGHGPGLLVTGWDRLPAYLAAATTALAGGWSVLAAFASVATAEAAAAAAERAGLRPVRLHGDLAAGARADAWRSLAGRRASLAVGTRATVFAPVADPVLVIVDDEDASGHKEERAPRYTTLGVALARTASQGLALRGTGTPTVAAYAAVQAGTLRYVRLPSPPVRLDLVDLRHRRDRETVVSRPVVDRIRRAVAAGGRAVVVVDRKGYAGGLHCAECGGVERCPRCGVAMAYDRAGRRLLCRLCGCVRPAPDACSRCGTAALRPLGAGTERVAAVLARLVPRVLRYDRDVVASGMDEAALLETFRRRGGVLVATTLVLPRLASLRPSVVAVLGADRWLHRPEYRSAERTLALLRLLGQASGRRVLVETADPEHPVLRAAVSGDLAGFYAHELALRRALGYPPFAVLARVALAGRSAAAVASAAQQLRAAAAAPVEVLGPFPGAGDRATAPPENARAILIVRAPDHGAFWPLLSPLLVAEDRPRGLRITVDVDPFEL